MLDCNGCSINHLNGVGVQECNHGYTTSSEALVKEGVSLEFATLLFQAWLTERDIQSVASALRKAQLEGKLVVGVDV